ncbi:MAG: TfoX/Sxy family protein [Proteobacteria bacterium]|nr:TfoX/Sxy family protein [Pseudomonadota bacterium]
MASDAALIERIRPILSERKGLSERRMFGGACFTLHGNMCVGTWRGSLLVRLGRPNHEAALAEPHVRPADMNGRAMRGWALVDPAGIDSEPALKAWVERAADFAETLPAK